jgi:hypothetical protein
MQQKAILYRLFEFEDSSLHTFSLIDDLSYKGQYQLRKN